MWVISEGIPPRIIRIIKIRDYADYADYAEQFTHSVGFSVN